MVNPDNNEAERASEVNAQKVSDTWRGVKPSGVFWNTGSLAQDNKYDTDYMNESSKRLNEVAAAAELQVKAMNDRQATADVWRGVKPSSVFAPSLAQDHKDYPEWLNGYNTKTMDTAAAAEAERQSEVDGQAASDVWRGVKPKGVFNGALAQDNKDYPEWLNGYNTKTMDTAAAAEA